MKYEYGIRHRKDPYPHREGLTELGAEQWIKEFIQDGGKEDAFLIIRRPTGDWEDVRYVDVQT